MKRDQRTGQPLFHGKQDARHTCVSSSINCVLTLYTWRIRYNPKALSHLNAFRQTCEVHYCLNLHDVNRIVLHNAGPLRLCSVGATVSYNNT